VKKTPPFLKELVTQSGSTFHGAGYASASRAASNGSMRCHPGIPVGFLRVGALDDGYGLVRYGESFEPAQWSLIARLQAEIDELAHLGRGQIHHSRPPPSTPGAPLAQPGEKHRNVFLEEEHEPA
jgi:hypothetical protein